MTITSASVVKDALRNNGDFEGLKFCLVYAYNGVDNDTTHFAAFIDPDHDDMALSPYVKSFTCLMSNGMLTVEGQKFLKGELR